MNCICKLNINGANGTGFFCKIPFENNETKVFFMTNYHVLDKNYYETNNKINLLINDEKEIKTIDLRIKRNTYFNEDNNITLIELNENDNIKYYLELDDNLFRHNNDILYENKSLYILQYPVGKNAAVSYGLLTSLDKYDIKHKCSTENGSSGAPILNLKTNKVNQTVLVFNQNRTVDEMLTIYLKTIKKPELIGQKYNPRFIYNGKVLKFGDKALISNLFTTFNGVFVIWSHM
jgi:V8-like Glu-specific endopeptidase